MWSMCDERKNPIADIDPQIKSIVATSSGMLDTDPPKSITSDASAMSAGSPKSNSDSASPIMYVNGDTGDATKTSCILYSVL